MEMTSLKYHSEINQSVFSNTNSNFAQSWRASRMLNISIPKNNFPLDFQKIDKKVEKLFDLQLNFQLRKKKSTKKAKIYKFDYEKADWRVQYLNNETKMILFRVLHSATKICP